MATKKKMSCTVPGCTKHGIAAKGLCSTHYMRQRRTGSTDDPPPANGLTEVFIPSVGMPALLKAEIERQAAIEGVSLTEWVRRAIRLRAGWKEIL